VEVRLFSVSCPSRGSCTAVGFSNLRAISTGGDTLAEHWDGTSWTIQPTPTPSQQALLRAVSCLSATDCIAVGTGGRTPLAEHWDGTSWTIQPVPFPAGSANAQPSAVSCASPTSCTAVGLYYLPQNDNQLPLAEHWDGTSWTVQQIPVPTGAFQADLTGVSCTSVTTCTAVGNYNGSTGGVPFAEQWNGTTWTVQTVSGPAGAALNAVSCTSPTACTAVGGFATRWNGTTWTMQTIPAGTGLAAVSCTSASSCTAVGTTGHPDGSLTGTAEHWDGTSWVAQATPAPKSAASAELFGVSCRSAAYCTAVGFYNTRKPLALHE
jgi:hypothetical protein